MQVVNKKMCVIVILVLVIIESCTLFLMYKSFSNKNTNLDEVNLNISNSNMFAIMLEQDDGTYKEDTTSTWPTSGYTYNESMSGCIDINGNRIEDALTYDKENNKANVNTTNTSYCYLYFSIKLPVFSEKILSNVSAYSDIEYVADGYRYVGLNPNNYVTFNNETWRIIGFFDGDQIGMTSGKYYVKLIKEEAIGAIAYDEDEDTELDWSKTTLYTYLNNEYYNTLLNDSKDMIVNAKWYYYISSVYDLGVSNREEAYINEKSSQSSTLYDAVGLIYPSDWAYAVPAVHGCNDANLASYFDESGCTSANWLASKADMWSIFLLGSEYKADRAYYISSFGLSYTSASLEFNIYPVVYLSSDVTIKGSGNGSETNKYELVL